MIKVNVKLDDNKNVIDFANKCNTLPFYADIGKTKASVDACDITGILMLGIPGIFPFVYYGDNKDDLKCISEYITDERMIER